MVNKRLIDVPCGKCVTCRKKKALEWSLRLENELEYSDYAAFITLTYSEDYLPVNEDGEAVLVKKHLQDFHKRLRQHITREFGKSSYRYYAVGEYGDSSDRPHYHIISFNIPPEVLADIESIWDYGLCDIGSVTFSSISYVTGYVIKAIDKDYTGKQLPFSSMSLKPAIGLKWLQDNEKFIKSNRTNCLVRNGRKVPMPRYYKNQLYTGVTRSLMAKKNIQCIDEMYDSSIKRLSKVSSDPENEFIRRKLNYEKLIEKRLKKNSTL